METELLTTMSSSITEGVSRGVIKEGRGIRD